MYIFTARPEFFASKSIEGCNIKISFSKYNLKFVHLLFLIDISIKNIECQNAIKTAPFDTF